MKRILSIFAAMLAASAATSQTAHAFSGEDPVLGHPWYHEKITREAAKAVGFSSNPTKDDEDENNDKREQDSAAEAIAWHADYIDSYLYNPIWWGQGHLDRYKASRAIQAELEKCHFDDLFSTDKVNAMWRRYASGAFAGLMWAKEHNDIYAAQNIVGVSLHAMQDFYAHSAWVDKKERREKTYFEYSKASRTSDPLYTGAYEHDHQLGVKSHGKWVPKDSIWGQPGVREIMEIASDPLSPFANTEAAEAYRRVKAGTPMQPTVGGVKLPSSIMVYTPAGIALDNKWVANESVKQRGIELTGLEAFDKTYALAERQSEQWLKTLEKAMIKARAGDFWNKVKTTPASDAQRFSQYENYGQFPFTFLSAGPYPPENTGGAEEWFLRVKIKTADELTAGTDADIRLKAAGQTFKLDYIPGANPVLAYNDFEAGDDNAYTVGPFSTVPSEMQLVNDAASGKELFKAIGNDFVNAVTGAVTGIKEVLLSVVGGHADHIATNKIVWMPEQLAAIPDSGTPFSIALNGGENGNYRVDGTIYKTAETDTDYEFAVNLDKLACIKESKWDRGSNSDEPFILTALNPLPGGQQSWMSKVFADVDTGESPALGQVYGRVTIPKSSGMLNLAISLMESDDESAEARGELLQKFAGGIESATEESKRTFSEALATTLAADWKIEKMEVVTWNRNGRIRQGKVFDMKVNRWIRAGETANFPLATVGAADTLVTTDELLPELDPSTQEPGSTPDTTSPTPTPATPSNDDISTWVDEWDTTYGRVKLELQDGVLRGRLMQPTEYGGEREGERLELRAGATPGTIEGTASYTGFVAKVTLTLSADGNSFTATSQQAVETKPNLWSGKRKRSRVPSTPGTPSGTPTSTPTPVPTSTSGNGNGNGSSSGNTSSGNTNGSGNNSGSTNGGATNGGTTTGGTNNSGNSGSGAGSFGDFQPIAKFDVQLESIKQGRGADKVEATFVFRNPAKSEASLSANAYDFALVDVDGVGIGNDPGYYRKDATESTNASLTIAAGASIPLRYVFNVGGGMAQLKKMAASTWNGYGEWNISGATLPNPVDTTSPNGIKGGTDFQPFGDDWDLRFDGWRRGRDGSIEVFATFRNMKKGLGYINYQNCELSVQDADGIVKEDNNLVYRVGGDRPEEIGRTMTVPPKCETKVRYKIAVDKSFVPSKFIFVEGRYKSKFEVPVTP
ncbi:MAG TPA: hypothetical protein VF600_17030 [Abditibacteriaceae bacterium]|jgi:hypothetical protein